MNKNLLAGACTAIVFLAMLNFIVFVKIGQLEAKIYELKDNDTHTENVVDAVSYRVDLIDESLDKQEEINKTLAEGTALLYEILGFGGNK